MKFSDFKTVNWRGLAKIAVVILLGAWYGFWLFHKIDISHGDVGRHLLGGQILASSIWHYDWATLSGLLHTNFYSYTFPDFPNINHHWGSEMLFYLAYRSGGFAFLTIFFAIVSLATFFIFFRAAVRAGGWRIAAGTAIFLIPLIGSRTEFRPEAFSYLLSAIFFYFLWEYARDRLDTRWLYLLPILQMAWVNLHIYFWLGPFLLIIFIIDARLRKPRPWRKIKKLFLILFLTLAAGLANPSGLNGLLYPFHIFGNYSVVVSENQSVPVWLVVPTYDAPRVFLAAFGALLILIAMSAVLAIVRKDRFPFVLSALGWIFGCLTYLAVRNFALFGFFALPAISMMAAGLAKYLPREWRRWVGVFVLSLMLSVMIVLNRHNLQNTYYNFGMGLEPGVAEPAEFIKNNHLPGVLCSGFDIGSYAIFYLFPDYRLFADNRPEAYPSEFWETAYRPMHADEKVWQKNMTDYGFQTILYSLQEKNTAVRSFIQKRLDDPEWAPVFINRFAIVLTKRTPETASVIKRYEVPKENVEKFFTAPISQSLDEGGEDKK